VDSAMPLLDPKKRSKRVAVSLRFEENLMQEISAYCSWLGITRLQDFFDQAADYILKNDKDWKQEKSSSKAAITKKMIKN
jgi:hypothetical protein